MIDVASGGDTSSAFEPSWQSHGGNEARLLAELLRSSRVTLLFAEPGSDKTALLKHDLIPLLRRSAGDANGQTPARESGIVVPFPDRRTRAPSPVAKRRKEVVVYFDDWTATPLEALHVRIQMAARGAAREPAVPRPTLADILEILSNRLDASFIILLDRCEQSLCAAAPGEDATEFFEELVEAINRPSLPANFLLSLDDAARPTLQSLRSRIPGFDDFSLKLTRPQGAEPPVIEPPAPVAAVSIVPAAPSVDSDIEHIDLPLPPPAAPPVARRKHTKKSRPPPPPPSTPQDVYAFIEETLAHTPTEIAYEPFDVVEGATPPVAKKRAVAAHAARTEAVATVPAPEERLEAAPAADTQAPPVDELTAQSVVHKPRSALERAVDWLRQWLQRTRGPTR